MTPFVTAGAAFLLAILYVDLIFDLQARRGRSRDGVPEDALRSIARYYRRMTVTARPLNRLVSVVMVGTLAAIVAQLLGDDAPDWAAAVSLGLAGAPILLAAVHTVPSAVRLGRGGDPPDVQAALARAILRDHVLCLTAIVALLVVQLGFAR